MNDASEEEKISTVNSTEHAVGYYSVSGDGTFRCDTSGLKTIRLPDKYPLDLLDGFTGRSPDYSEVQLQHLLMWIQKNKSCLNDVHFVCTRGQMCKVLNSHYDWRYEYKFYATIFNDVIYVSEEQQKTQYFYNENSKASFAGFRFEQYVNGNQQNAKVQDVRSQEVVFKRTFENLNFLYSAEVDGIWFNPKTERFELVEVKCRKIEYENYGFERNKSRCWFLQSYLTSVNKFVCGFRDDNYLLRFANDVDVSEVRESGVGFWKIDPCIRRVRTNFRRLRKLVRDPNHVYEIYKPSCSKKLKQTGKFKGSILPEWYTSSVK